MVNSLVVPSGFQYNKTVWIYGRSPIWSNCVGQNRDHIKVNRCIGPCMQGNIFLNCKSRSQNSVQEGNFQLTTPHAQFHPSILKTQFQSILLLRLADQWFSTFWQQAWWISCLYIDCVRLCRSNLCNPHINIHQPIQAWRSVSCFRTRELWFQMS